MRRLLVPLLLAGLGAAPPERDSQEVAVDGAHEVVSAPPGPLPVLGPRLSPVTIDLFPPLGVPAAAANVALALRLVREVPGLRLVYHPMPTASPMAERGTELLWEALAQQRFWATCELLYQKPDLLQLDREPQLLAAAQGLGLDGERLRQALLQRPHRARVQELWRRDGAPSASALWVNGRSPPAPLSEALVRDEIEHERERAQALLQQGVTLSQIYERLSQRDRPAVTRPRAPRRLHADLDGAPSRGPAVAPVVVVFYASLDAHTSRAYGELVRGAMARHPDKLRLLLKPLPSSYSYASQQVAWYLLMLHQRAPRDFFRAYDALLQATGQRFQLTPPEIPALLRRAGLDLAGIPPSPVPGLTQRMLEANVAEAKRLGIEGPPALLVNGQLQRGSLTAEALEELLRRELEQGLIGRLQR